MFFYYYISFNKHSLDSSKVNLKRKTHLTTNKFRTQDNLLFSFIYIYLLYLILNIYYLSILIKVNIWVNVCKRSTVKFIALVVLKLST